MKKLFIVLSVITLFSCEDPSIVDPMTGNWKFKSLDVRNTKPIITMNLNIVPTADGKYIATKSEVFINTILNSNNEVTINKLPNGKLDILIREKSNAYTIHFTPVVYVNVADGLFADNMYYGANGSPEISYYGQTLQRD